MLAEIVQSSFTGHGDPSELCSLMGRVVIFNAGRELNMLWRVNNLFRENGRTKTNLDKNNSPWTTTRQITLHIICVYFQVVFFEIIELPRIWDSWRSLWRNNQGTYFYWSKAGIFLKRSSFISEDVAVCFAIYFGFLTRLACVTQQDFLLQSDKVFSKELAIAKISLLSIFEIL